jgi:hypothetical protein
MGAQNQNTPAILQAGVSISAQNKRKSRQDFIKIVVF